MIYPYNPSNPEYDMSSFFVAGSVRHQLQQGYLEASLCKVHDAIAFEKFYWSYEICCKKSIYAVWFAKITPSYMVVFASTFIKTAVKLKLQNVAFVYTVK